MAAERHPYGSISGMESEAAYLRRGSADEVDTSVGSMGHRTGWVKLGAVVVGVAGSLALAFVVGSSGSGSLGGAGSGSGSGAGSFAQRAGVVSNPAVPDPTAGLWAAGKHHSPTSQTARLSSRTRGQFFSALKPSRELPTMHKT